MTTEKLFPVDPRAPDSHDFVVMPKALTAENGAKALFMGAFNEYYTIDNPDYCGCGECDECLNGDGEFLILDQQVAVSWTTIKEIYAMAVRELGKGPAAK